MKRQLTVLFLAQFMIMAVGVGLMALMPLYAGTLGATSTGAGLLLAGNYVGMAVGAMSAGALAVRVGSYKRLFVIGFGGVEP